MPKIFQLVGLLATGASLAAYATGSPNAAPTPNTATPRVAQHSQASDHSGHDHGAHDHHSAIPSLRSAPSSTLEVPAPLGGPPLLPSTVPARPNVDSGAPTLNGPSQTFAQPPRQFAPGAGAPYDRNPDAATYQTLPAGRPNDLDRNAYPSPSSGPTYCPRGYNGGTGGEANSPPYFYTDGNSDSQYGSHSGECRCNCPSRACSYESTGCDYESSCPYSFRGQ